MSETKKRLWQATRWTGLIIREIAGWALLLGGLNTFRTSLQYLERQLVVEGFVAAVMGVMLFRGGLQLVKVAVAARAFRQNPRPGDSDGIPTTVKASAVR